MRHFAPLLWIKSIKLQEVEVKMSLNGHRGHFYMMQLNAAVSSCVCCCLDAVNVISFIQKQKANMFADVLSGFTAAVSLGSLTAVSYRGNTVQSLQRFTDWT